MENVLDVAAYICDCYQSEYGEQIDEMKLHKLMYFAQRESYIQTGEPLFNATFYGWKYGPILKEVREAYRNRALFGMVVKGLSEACYKVLERILNDFAGKDSWSLSRLTHGELSWQNSRMGCPEYDKSDNPMKNEDIKEDAERIKERRKMREMYGMA